MFRSNHEAQDADALFLAMVASAAASVERLMVVALANIAVLRAESAHMPAEGTQCVEQAADAIEQAAEACEVARQIVRTLPPYGEDHHDGDSCTRPDDLHVQIRKSGRSFAGNAQCESIHVLLVEDDAFIRDVLCGLLTTVGVAVRVAPDGPGAFSTLREGSFDAVIVDLTLSGGTGLDLARGVRDQFPRMPVAVISGDEEYLDAISDAGLDMLIRKPIRADELCETVSKVIARASIRRAS